MQWFGRPLEPLRVEWLAADLSDTGQLAAVGFPDGGTAGPYLGTGRLRLLFRYLTDRRVFRAGRTTIWVDPAGEVEALARIGASLRDEIAGAAWPSRSTRPRTC